jgi:Rieske 2Fe-2S family protein
MATTTGPAKTLPGPAYHSDETYEVDRERVFFKHWLYAARAERISTPGSWLRLDIAGESILLVRGKDDRIRGFYNVCRHRGSQLCDGEAGQVRSHLRCPYHAWGYALDGSLVTTPMIERDEVDREQHSLWPVRTDSWEGFVFVNFSRE